MKNFDLYPATTYSCLPGAESWVRWAITHLYLDNYSGWVILQLSLDEAITRGCF